MLTILRIIVHSAGAGLAWRRLMVTKRGTRGPAAPIYEAAPQTEFAAVILLGDAQPCTPDTPEFQRRPRYIPDICLPGVAFSNGRRARGADMDPAFLGKTPRS